MHLSSIFPHLHPIFSVFSSSNPSYFRSRSLLSLLYTLSIKKIAPPRLSPHIPFGSKIPPLYKSSLIYIPLSLFDASLSNKGFSSTAWMTHHSPIFSRYSYFSILPFSNFPFPTSSHISLSISPYVHRPLLSLFYTTSI